MKRGDEKNTDPDWKRKKSTGLRLSKTPQGGKAPI